jgi:hypothetical protein
MMTALIDTIIFSSLYYQVTQGKDVSNTLFWLAVICGVGFVLHAIVANIKASQ